MKRIRALLLTLVLSVSLLAPEFSMLPAAYAYDEPPVVTNEQSEGAADATAAGSEAEGKDDAAKGGTEDPIDGVTVDPENPDGPIATPDGPSDDPTDDPAAEYGSYDLIYMTKLNEAGTLKLPEELQDKITAENAQYGNGLLFTGNVGDLNAAYIELANEFDFDSGSVGRIYFDGLKDKDRGMDVEVEIYLDDGKTPVSSIPLKKQMGKREWANTGDKSFSLGSGEISGKHKVALRLKITGKADDKKTTVMLRSIQFCMTTVPMLYFNIDESEGTIEAMNNSDDHSVECYGTVDLVVPDTFNADETFRDEYGKQESIKGLELEYIRGRGNSTWSEDKRPYKVKFDKAQDLFGFGKNKHWVLLANRFDNSLVRNRMTYWLGQQLGMPYTPQCVPVEVVMNGEFYGSYLLCEQIRIGKGRVTIDDLDDVKDPPALTDEMIQTGGYLLSMDYEYDPVRYFRTEHIGGSDRSFYIESPDDNVNYFHEYIKAYMQKVENAIFGEDFKDAEGHPYTDYLDLDAAVDYWWVQEFSENGDAYGSNSTYLYKSRDVREEDGSVTIGKLCWGPLWDFDYVAWGDLDYESEPQETLEYTSMEWFETMKADPVFLDKVRERWSEPGGLRDKVQEITKEGGLLDRYIAQMETSYNYDHEKWGSFQSELTEYRDEIEQLREWIIKRTAYVDGEVEKLKIEDHTVKFMVGKKVVKEIVVHGILKKEDFPEAPEKAGFVFDGWIDEDNFDKYEPGSRVMSDITLVAEYTNKNDIVQPKALYFKEYEAYVGASDEDYFEEGDVLTWYYPEYRIMPEEAWDNEITWSSSDESIAKVDPEESSVAVYAFGDVTITATLKNGVSRSFVLHVVGYDDMQMSEGVKISRTSLNLKRGGYSQLLALPINTPCDETGYFWVSSDEKVATVDDLGIVKAVGTGTTDILLINTYDYSLQKCRVTVKSNSNLGKVVKRDGSTYKITSDKKGKRTAMLVKAKNAQKVVIPAYIKIGKKKYSVNKIKAKAFAKSKAQKVVVKTKKLTTAGVKGSMKGSKVRKIYVKVGNAKTNKAYVKKYTKIFRKKYTGKPVYVKM